MNKVPVGDTISRTYGFTFSNLLSIFGTVWLPYVVVLAVFAGFVFLVAPDLPGMLMRGQFDPFALGRVSRTFGLLGILTFIIGSMVTVGVQRKALGRHQGPVWIYFSVGAPVWRMAGAFFLAGLVIFFIGLVTAGAAVAAWFAAGHFVPGYAVLVRVLVCLAAVLWFIYLCVRLLFFLPPVVVAEERIGLARSWELGGGNFWRIVVVAIAVFVPVLVGFGIVYSALLGSVVSVPHLHAGMDMRDMVRDIFRQALVFSPVALVLRVIERVLFVGLSNGASANAYLAVTGAAGAAAPPSAAADG